MAAAQQSNPKKTQSAQQAVDQGLVGRSLSKLLQFVLFSLATLCIAILIEWVGMTFIWETEGPNHSAQMLNTELSYLSGDFKRSAIVGEPVQFARRFADSFYDIIFRKTGLERGIIWMATLGPNQNITFYHWLSHAYHLADGYVQATVNIIGVFAIRLAVLVLSSPAFILLALIGAVDGLTQRDIRRWGGGRESAFIYHWAKKLIVPCLGLPWVIYLAMPVSIHPNFIVLPFAVLLALSVRIMASTFKKYL
ncbi:MAG: TIGR03747 family integrating conjugative element membrane protein [Methylococcales bacterium]